MSGACNPMRLRLHWQVIHKHLPLIHVPSKTIAQRIAPSSVSRLETESGIGHVQPTARARQGWAHAWLCFMDHTQGLFPLELQWDPAPEGALLPWAVSRLSSHPLQASHFCPVRSRMRQATGQGSRGHIWRIPKPAAL